MHQNVPILAAQPFLRGLTPEQLNLLAEDSMPAEFQPGERILSEGAPANRFYLILEGRVELESSVLDGEPVAVQTLGAGDLLGWSWLFPPFCWHFDARAVLPTKAILFYAKHVRELCEQALTPVKAICFYGKHVREVCDANHDLGYELMKRVSIILIQRLQCSRSQWVVHHGG
jgi:CRP-like cAMP-binding protein